MQNNTQALTLALSRRLAIADKRPQQAVMVQTAARLLNGASDSAKNELMRFIALSPQERHDSLNITESLFLAA